MVWKFIFIIISGGNKVLKMFDGLFTFNMSNRSVSVWRLFSGHLTIIFN